jgi:hypothetical protein
MELSSLYLERIKDATERGIEREAISFVMRLLNRRFGLIAPDIEQKIRNLPVNRLEDLGEALLDFQSATDLSNWIEQAN